MWLATRHEGFDGLVSGSVNKSSRTVSFIEKRISGTLRWGFFLQLMAGLGMILTHYVYGGTAFYTYDLRHSTEDMRGRVSYRNTYLFLSVIYFIGTLNLVTFATCVADDSAWSRAYRAGSKLLQLAVFFDTFASLLFVSTALSFATFYNEAYWSHFRLGNLDWIFSTGARVAHAIGVVILGLSLLLLECYHDEGTNDVHGVLNFFLFVGAGLAELLILFNVNPAICGVMNLVALASAFLWSISFEQTVNASSPGLDESELCNELENEIDKLTALSPSHISNVKLHRGQSPAAGDAN